MDIVTLCLVGAVVALAIIVEELRKDVNDLKERLSACEWKNKSLENTLGDLRAEMD